MAPIEQLLSETSPSSNTTTAGTQEAIGLDRYDWFMLDATLTQATGGTLDVYVQRWCSKLAEWRDWIAFPQLAAGSTVFRYTVMTGSGTSITVVGQGTSPTLAANTFIGGHPGSKVRMCFKAGASTSAGAVQKVCVTGWKSRS
jgi:hypothetical protein